MKRFPSLVLFALLALPTYAQALSLTQSGSGTSATVTVVSSGQFKLVWEAYDNWGLSQWYDLVNDPSATTNLALAYGVGGAAQPCEIESSLQNMVFYGDGDEKAYTTVAGCTYPSATRTMSILVNTSPVIILQTTAHPMASAPAIDTNVTVGNTYYIYPDGRIYTHDTISVVNAQDLGAGGTVDTFVSTMELNDPVATGANPPDSSGWIRASAAQNPYTGSDGVEQTYLFSYWGSGTPSPYTNFTKASILLIPSPNNPNWSKATYPPLQQIIHSWSCGTGCGTMRWGYRITFGPNLPANTTIAYDFLMQLGTQGSSSLQDFTTSGTCTICNTISSAYDANPFPPNGPPTASISGATLSGAVIP